MSKPNVKRKDIINFCNSNFACVDSDSKINELIKLIIDNKDKVDINRIKELIEEEIEKPELK